MSLQSTYSWHQRQRQLQRSNRNKSFKSKFLYSKKYSSQSLEDEELAVLRKELLTHADKLISATKEKEKQILQQYTNKDREEQREVSNITSKASKDLQLALACVRQHAQKDIKYDSISQKRKGGRMWLNIKRKKKVRFSSTVISPVKDSFDVGKVEVDEQRDDDCNMNEVLHSKEDDEVTLLRNALHSLTQLQKLSMEAKENGVSEERDLVDDTGGSILNWLRLIDCCAFNTAFN